MDGGAGEWCLQWAPAPQFAVPAGRQPAGQHQQHQHQHQHQQPATRRCPSPVDACPALPCPALPLPCLQESGAVISDALGNPLDFTLGRHFPFLNGGIVAATPSMHAAIMAALRKIRAAGADAGAGAAQQH